MSMPANGPRLFLLMSVLVCSGLSAQTPTYLDATRPPDERAHDLVQRMTLEEKASQMLNHAEPIPRLQLPGYNWWSEALHGVVSPSESATVFPEPIGLAASFDPELVHRMGEAISIEGRIRHRQAVKDGATGIFEGLTFFSPNINLFRDPRWGRGQETYGEDPLLTSRMGVAFILGLQGADPLHPNVVATAKHFAVHSGPESLRHEFNAKVSDHDLEDSYLPAFRAAVVEGHVASVMCVYNAINGTPGCANAELLDSTLRKDWGFRGYVVSDCNAVSDISEHHHFAADAIDARALAVRAGMDNECMLSAADFGAPVGPEAKAPYQDYVDAVREGKLPESDLSRAVERSISWRFALGTLDSGADSTREQPPEALADGPEHRALALQAALESMVLLKNNGILPLRRNLKKLAVIGPLADQVKVLAGNYAGFPSRSTTVLEGLRRQFPTTRIAFERGSNFPGEPPLLPVSWFSDADGKPGLRIAYYADRSVDGQPLLQRDGADPAASPGRNLLPGHPHEAYTIRWTGYLTPTTSGRYQLALGGDSDAFWLDGKVLLDTRGAMLAPLQTVTVDLKAGHRYTVELQSLPGLMHELRLLGMLLQTQDDFLRQAVEAARQAEVVVAVVGITSQLEGEESKVDLPGFKGGDRTSLDLPASEERLLEALKSTGKPLVVVLMNGSALSINWAAQHADAILEAWYPGEEGGAAVAQTLAGAYNPAGRLPVTFYKSVSQLPPFEDYFMNNRTYRYFAGKPLYPFGYGLSYTHFQYSSLALSTRVIDAGQPLTATVRVRNTGHREGDEIVQLYVHYPVVAGAALQALAAFQRIHLRARESREVQLLLGPRELSFVDDSGRRVIRPASDHITVGGNSTDANLLTADFEIRGSAALAR